MRARLILIWCCFAAGGAFYCSILPLWEGFDEWAYFAVVDHMRATGEIIVDRNLAVSEEINKSLDLAPLPRGMTRMPPDGVGREDYWKLTDSERERRQTALASLTGNVAESPRRDGMPAYEASQAPLFYWLTAVLLKPFGGASLLTRVWIARLLSFLIGAMVVPCAFVLFRQFWKDSRLALAGTALVASLPALSLNLARVSNESLNLVLFTVLALILLKLSETPESWKWCVLAGVTLGAGLLTKASFLTAVPGSIAAFAAAIFLQTPLRPPWPELSNRIEVFMSRVGALLGIAGGIAGWWYLRNLLQTGTLSGLDEALMLRGTSFTAQLHGVWMLNWKAAIATVFLSHIWYGGWNLVALPHWPYIIGFAIGILAVAGVGWKLRENAPSNRGMLVLISLYAFFWLGQAYQMVMMFLSKGSSTAMGGWYLQCMVAIEVVLLYGGLSTLVPSLRSWLLPLLTLAAGTLDFLALHTILLPYFTENSLLQNLARLAINKPQILTPTVLVLLWVIYILHLLVLQTISLGLIRSNPR